MNPVVAVLERRLGLSPGAVGGRALDVAVGRRLTATGATDATAYAGRLQADRREFDELVEAVVVPETWFLRYPESFRHLAGWAAGRRRLLPVGRPLRVLCVPCSTGEEAYSVALTLLDAGLPAGGFRVDGVDVSGRAVAAAESGVYPDSAFRDADAVALRPRHFTRAADGWAVRDEVRTGVRFRTGNLIDPGFLADEPAYDAVFCRNLFIYLTPEARRTATAALERLLAPGGVAYMGHAEPLGLADGRFKSLPPPQAFVFGRSDRAVEKPAPAPTTARTPKPHGQRSTGAPAATPASPPKPSPPDLLGAARAAADRGDPGGAAALAEQHLAAHGPSADAFSLLGVARGMAGDPAAAEAAFTRALYLDPRHYDSLVHLLALAEARGDAAAAANYRRRAEAAHRQEADR